MSAVTCGLFGIKTREEDMSRQDKASAVISNLSFFEIIILRACSYITCTSNDLKKPYEIFTTNAFYIITNYLKKKRNLLFFSVPQKTKN